MNIYFKMKVYSRGKPNDIEDTNFLNIVKNYRKLSKPKKVTEFNISLTR